MTFAHINSSQGAPELPTETPKDSLGRCMALAAAQSAANVLLGARWPWIGARPTSTPRGPTSLGHPWPPRTPEDPKSSQKKTLKDQLGYSQWRARPGTKMMNEKPNALAQHPSNTGTAAPWQTPKPHHVGSQNAHMTMTTPVLLMDLQSTSSNGAAPPKSHQSTMCLSSF